MGAHSKVGASGMSRWSKCPGSVQLSEQVDVVETPSQYAAEGTAAHHLAEMCLLKGYFAHAFSGHFITVMDSGGSGYTHKEASEGIGRLKGRYVFEVTKEMVENVQLYLDAVRTAMNCDPDAELLVEKKFHLKQIHEALYGTADAVVWLPHASALHVFDLKYGAGVPVEAIGNPQLRYYALGALLETGYSAAEVGIHVVQPRCPHSDGPHRSETLDAMELLEFAGDLREAVERTEDPDAPLVPGDHCRWCKAAAICPKLRDTAQEAAAMEFREDLSFDPEELARALELAPVVEAWAKSVREFAYSQAEHGAEIPRHKLVAKRATRKWRDERIAEYVLTKYLDEEDAYTHKLLTPPQAEKKLPATAKEELKEAIVAESSGHTLVHESDKRPAVKASAQDDFS